MLACPVCGTSNISKLLSVTAEEAAQHFVLAEEDSDRDEKLINHIRYLWQDDVCDILKCAGCGFGFSYPYVAGDPVFYNLAYKAVGYPSSKWEYTRTIEAMGSLEKLGKRALEIGAGFGFFLDMICPEILKPSDIVAVEYNNESISHLIDKGYMTVSKDIRDDYFNLLLGHFDFIFMFQVLEHMDDIHNIFARLAFLTKPGANIFIAVPNAGRIAFNESHGSLLDMPPNHIGRWTTEAFGIMSDKHGFKIINTEVEPFSLAAFIKMDIGYSYLRKAQLRGSLANRVRSMPRSGSRKLREAAVAAVYTPPRLAVWLARVSSRTADLGGSLWVQLNRQ